MLIFAIIFYLLVIPTHLLIIITIFLWYNRKKSVIFILKAGACMQTRVVLLGIIVENTAAVEQLNILLHAHNEYIIGRMGLPYKQKGINIISIVLDAPTDVISTLSGKIGMLKGVSVKALYAKAPQGQPS